MRTLVLLLVALSGALSVPAARADDALYRCESAAGISIQSTPCPKGVSQKKISFERPADPVAPPAAAPDAAPAVAAPKVSTVAGHPVAPAIAMHGPNDPYPLWQCMRADGSTYDSRDGVPRRQWVAKTAADDAAAREAQAVENAKLAERIRKGEPVVRPYADSPSPSDASPSDAPPPDAPPGQWVVDQCTQLEPDQACARYATRRDALRRQIYAAKPSERSLYAPEEQDLTSMLFAACGR